MIPPPRNPITTHGVAQVTTFLNHNFSFGLLLLVSNTNYHLLWLSRQGGGTEVAASGKLTSVAVAGRRRGDEEVELREILNLRRRSVDNPRWCGRVLDEGSRNVGRRVGVQSGLHLHGERRAGVEAGMAVATIYQN